MNQAVAECPWCKRETEWKVPLAVSGVYFRSYPRCLKVVTVIVEVDLESRFLTVFDPKSEWLGVVIEKSALIRCDCPRAAFSLFDLYSEGWFEEGSLISGTVILSPQGVA